MSTAEASQNYPPLPAGPPPAEEVARAQYVSFVFPKKMTYSRPWLHLVGAILNETAKAPTIAFLFADLLATVKFPMPETDSPLGFWQSYLDGKLTAIEHSPGKREIQIRYAELPELAHSYPPQDAEMFAESSAGNGEPGAREVSPNRGPPDEDAGDEGFGEDGPESDDGPEDDPLDEGGIPG